ncbi:MAG: DUF4115 domain-containing protein [Acidobacteria bacterium]|nr:DUF4115 domain-containing protein [Acidobacteriota bacterium]MBI3281658.1 DUF4115 domain-containing protein [Acidobacteriota bacterium]
MSIGERLRREREVQQRTLPELSRATRIQEHLLQAIERDDVNATPGLFFYKSFVRQYAQALRLDPSEFEESLRTLAAPDQHDVLRVLSGMYQPAEREFRPLPRPRPMLARVSLLLVALFGGSAFYGWWLRTQVREPREAARTEPRVPQRVGLRAVSNERVLPAASSAAAAEQQRQRTLDAPAALELVASEETWISVTSGGKSIFMGTLQPADARRFVGLESARLRTGNAGGLEVRWRGERLAPVGPRGHVRTVMLNPDGARILPAAEEEDNAEL